MRKAILIAAAILVGCGGGGGSPPCTEWGCLVAEQTDYFDGTTYHRYYRGNASEVGYAWSTDGIHFEEYPGNPLMQGHFPILVQAPDGVYLLVKQAGEYNLYDISVKTRPSLVKTVLTGGYFNAGIAVVGDRWHMLIEDKADETFRLRYAWANWPDLEFTVGPVVFNDAGNPWLHYVPERNAILAFYGADYRATGIWRVRTAVFDFTSWQTQGMVIERAGVHMADPDLGVGGDPNPVIITVGSSQDSVDTFIFQGTKLDLFDAIIAGHVEIECLGKTMGR